MLGIGLGLRLLVRRLEVLHALFVSCFGLAQVFVAAGLDFLQELGVLELDALEV